MDSHVFKIEELYQIGDGQDGFWIELDPEFPEKEKILITDDEWLSDENIKDISKDGVIFHDNDNDIDIFFSKDNIERVNELMGREASFRPWRK